MGHFDRAVSQPVDKSGGTAEGAPRRVLGSSPAEARSSAFW
ncbi:hypothetical protein SLNHY_2706 [Streptomyces albus]|nr:hypothetical protein SLNHY_2706 [Streptomyces albus]